MQNLITVAGYTAFEAEQDRNERQERWAIIVCIALTVGGWGAWYWKFGNDAWGSGWRCHMRGNTQVCNWVGEGEGTWPVETEIR